jgi:hypothetical protein
MESKTQTQIIKEIEKMGGYSVKIMSCNKNGFPDLHFLLPSTPYPIPCYCEVKQKGKKARAMQLFRIKELQQIGAVAFEADSLEQFKTKILCYQTFQP